MHFLDIVLVFLIPALAAFLVVGLIRLIRRSMSPGTGTKPDYVGCGCLFVLFTFIALLAMDFLPHDHGPAKRTACLSNCSYLAKALLLYSEDYDDHLPPMNAWCDAISEIVDDASAFHCPELRGVAFSYGLNRDTRLVVDSPERLVLGFDALGGKNYAGGVADVQYRHRNDIAVLFFADGHVKSATQAEAQKYDWKPKPE